MEITAADRRHWPEALLDWMDRKIQIWRHKAGLDAQTPGDMPTVGSAPGLDARSIGVVRWKPDGSLIAVNDYFLGMLGYDRDTFQSGWRQLTPPEWREADDHALVLTLNSGSCPPFEKELLHRDGRRVPVLVEVHGTADGGTAVIHDMSERNHLMITATLANHVYDTAQEGIVISNPDGKIVYVNPAFVRTMGYSVDELIGHTPRVFRSYWQSDKFYASMWVQLLSDGHWCGEIWNRRKDGAAILEWESITAVRDENGSIQRFVAVLSDITELRRKDHQLEHLYYHDTLTGLPNRHLMLDRLKWDIQAAKRSPVPLAVLCLDLDRFKTINECHGHRAGDELICQVAKRLQETLRESDSISRFGGDEFIIVLHELEQSRDAAEVARKITKALRQPFDVFGTPLTVTASIGIALFPDDAEDCDTLLARAEIAMYQRKSLGRDGHQFFDADRNQEIRKRLSLESRLRQATDNGNFELHYQPKVILESGQPAGAEALLRWRDSDGTLIPPDNFIPIAEETGLIVPIGDWVMREAARQLSEWRIQGQDAGTIAINISARQLHDKRFPHKLASYFSTFGVDDGSMELELTESAVMHDPETAVQILTEIKAITPTISVDDFGTGYSSLAYLKRLPITGLKIDRTFVADIDTDPEDAEIVKTIISLAKALRLDVVAEGVETISQIDFLRRHHCATAQGYHYAQPLPPRDYIHWCINARSATA